MSNTPKGVSLRFGVERMRSKEWEYLPVQRQKQSGDNEILRIAQQVAGHGKTLRQRAEKEKEERRDLDRVKQFGED